MKLKFFAVVLVILIFSPVAYSGEAVNQDKDIHSVVGGLYALSAAVSLNNNSNPEINILRRYFMSTPENARVERVNNSIWVGVPVGKFSNARHFLRSNAPALGITDSPEGYSWMGGDFAWLKAADISGKKIKFLTLKASKGSGTDSGIIFLTTHGQDSWWQANPAFTKQAINAILNKYEAKDAPTLHAPAGSAVSIYESVKPAPVAKPGKMHVGGKSSADMSIEVGDVMFSPIPRVGGSNNSF
ncbi:MAG: hypothetical protein IJT21_01645 [Synergistaceae bacterium]|nr:hypothetical protein [Synergistaceae bacterium]